MQAQTLFWSNSTKAITQLIINPLNTELNPKCHLLALLGGTTTVVVSRLRFKHPTSDKTRRFLTAFTRTSHLSSSFP